jgi:hypothetical protein
MVVLALAESSTVLAVVGCIAAAAWMRTFFDFFRRHAVPYMWIIGSWVECTPVKAGPDTDKFPIAERSGCVRTHPLMELVFRSLLTSPTIRITM